MFVSPEPEAALAAATRVIAEVEGDEVLPQARAGLDFGEVLPAEGDYFGHPVNVAARLVALAQPGTVAASKSFVESLPVASVTAESLGIHELKGVGAVEVFKVGL